MASALACPLALAQGKGARLSAGSQGEALDVGWACVCGARALALRLSGIDSSCMLQSARGLPSVFSEARISNVKTFRDGFEVWKCVPVSMGRGPIESKKTI